MYYSKEYFRELAPLIRMPSEALEALEAHFDALDPIEAEETAKFWANMRIKGTEKLTSVKSIADREQGDLLCVLIYMAAAGYAHENYRKLGISDRIFYDTFNCLAEKMLTCMRFHGYWGYPSVDWPIYPAGLELFRIGRLSYHMRVADADYMVNGRVLIAQGTPFVYLHIADNDKLVGCEESIREARAFIAKFYPAFQDTVIYTHTWLLDTRLSEILPETSNILQFQKLFDIMEIEDNIPSVAKRVFGGYKENPDDYEVYSAFSQRVVDYLKEGKPLGVGIGVAKK